MAWRTESRKQHERKGLGTFLSLVRTVSFFSGVLGKVLFYWWATLEPDSEVKKEKRTLNPYKGNFKISFNSLLGSKKHMSKQNNKSKTRCYIEKLKEQNAAYSGSFS